MGFLPSVQRNFPCTSVARGAKNWAHRESRHGYQSIHQGAELRTNKTENVTQVIFYKYRNFIIRSDEDLKIEHRIQLMANFI